MKHNYITSCICTALSDIILRINIAFIVSNETSLFLFYFRSNSISRSILQNSNDKFCYIANYRMQLRSSFIQYVPDTIPVILLTILFLMCPFECVRWWRCTYLISLLSSNCQYSLRKTVKRFSLGFSMVLNSDPNSSLEWAFQPRIVVIPRLATTLGQRVQSKLQFQSQFGWRLDWFMLFLRIFV